MNAFDDRLYDGSDPTYAPGINYRGKYCYWKAPAKYVKAGYAIKSVPLGVGSRDDEHHIDRAARCRDLTREMLQWWSNLQGFQTKPGTWHWLIGRYRTDEFSPIHEVKPNTRENYLWLLSRWDEIMGHVSIGSTNYEMVMKIRAGMQKKGRSVSYIHRMFTMLRTVARYGSVIGDKEAQRVSGVLSNLRIPTAPARSVAPTRKDIEAIVRESDKAGNKTFSVGLLMQYWFALRAVDVRGQYADGVWQDGLTWEMFDKNFRHFEKVISKTKRSMPDPIKLSLKNTPDIRERLIEIYEDLPERCKIGPVTLNLRTLEPYTVYGWAQCWRRYRDLAGVDKRLRLMDSRAGAGTDAARVTKNPVMLRNALQHANTKTTDKYLRDRSESANRVVALRRKG